MEQILDVAQYIYDKYRCITGSQIDEMKLHKLLYFSQRESFALTGKPLFKGNLCGWKFGPVSPEVRLYYSDSGILADTKEVSSEAAYLLNNVIFEYGAIASWKLSELSHRETSWLNARTGLKPNQNGNNVLSLADIKFDSEKVRPYDHVWDMYYDEFDDYECEGGIDT